MTAPRQDDQGPASEAARWLVALDDDPEDAVLRARFEAWRSASPANARAWANAVHVYERMAHTRPAHEAHWAAHAARRDEGARLPAAGRRPRPRRAGRGWGPAVAVAVTAACLALLVAPAALLRLQADHRTGTAELRSVWLDDGSSVHLGPASAIAVELDGRRRRIRLLQGEALFEVEREPDRPFQVIAGDTVTTVLGTAFDVRLDAGGAAVAVERGRVRVERSSGPARPQDLTAGQWVRVVWGGPTDRGAIAPDEIAPWLRGQVVARDRPLAEMVDQLRPYFAGVILLLDGDLGRQRLSGVYNVADPAAALRAMAAAHGGQVRQISPWLLVVSGS
ncbi:hypothetical protein STVA_42100 [Allostella vacuolata]|nr:hypothetical protein STVA_42100 [Stella vacuolata]